MRKWTKKNTKIIRKERLVRGEVRKKQGCHSRDINLIVSECDTDGKRRQKAGSKWGIKE